MTASSYIPRFSPNLESLCLTYPDEVDASFIASRPLFHDILPPLRALKHLELKSLPTPVPLEDVAKLTALPCLAELMFIKGTAGQALIVSPPTRDNNSEKPSQYTFGSLRFLYLEPPGTLDDCIALFSCFRFPMIKRLLVAASQASDANAVNDLSKAICDNCSHDTLESVSITSGFGSNGDVNTPRGTVPSAALRRLCCFRNLTRFELTTKLPIALDDAVLEELATSWPRMERLELASSAPDQGSAPHRATVRGLAHLARHCPLLTVLAISVDVRGADLYLPRAEHRNACLWAVDFYRSPVAGEDAHRVGAFLYALFPKLAVVEGNPVYDRPEDRASWGLVMETIIQCKQGLVDVAAVLVGCP